MQFQDRIEAGRMLASQLEQYARRPDALVLGLPRGGVPVAFEVARALHLPLDVMLVRKLGVPGQEELAMGAIASGGRRILNAHVIEDLGIPAHIIDMVTARECQELERRERLYRGSRPAANVRGRVVILVDDGIATGATMRAAIAALRQAGAASIVVAVPVAPPPVCADLRDEADEVICLMTPALFFGVGRWYQDFSPTTDDEVRFLLDQAAEAPAL